MTYRKIIAQGVAVLALVATSSVALAETLMMPNRDARNTAQIIVWGVHTQAAGTPCSLNFGDGTPDFNCTGLDRSYIAQPHFYANQGTYTATLTVGAESATTTIKVFNPLLFADGGAAGPSNRSLGVNMAIQDGLRWLWTQQAGRAASFPAVATTSWNTSGFSAADTSLVVLAFENQGYRITANVAPTGIYEKYIVRRGLNYVLSRLGAITLGNTPAGNNPCVGVPADANVCQGLRTIEGDDGYTTAAAILSFAGSGALAQINTEVAGVTNGKTYGEVLQRLVNALAWGQNDAGGSGRGGWDYSFNSTFRADGSTIGWDVLALLDAAAAGATVPAWVKTEFAALFSTGGILNDNGTFDYVADNNSTFENSTGPQKAGIGLQGLFLIGETTGARVVAVRDNINSWWNGGPGIGQNPWLCGNSSAANKGCAYSMFNNFKGLKLQNIVTLPAVTRPAGPGTIPANDWYADYVDWLVANQSNPNLTSGGNWGTMGFSCCHFGNILPAVIAELILAPVALVAPDPTLFSTVGLSPATATNPVGTSHTVTAFAQAANGAPVPGVTINFRVLTGPNAGKTGTSSTGGDGKTSFTYTDTGGGPGTDTIQAFIGTSLASNQVTKTWVVAEAKCDLDSDGDIDSADIRLITALRGKTVPPADPKADADSNGIININDARACVLRCTRTSCATQ